MSSYASFEVWNEILYDNKSDKRSLRYAIYEMLTLNPPFCAINVENYKIKLLRIYMEKFWINILKI